MSHFYPQVEQPIEQIELEPDRSKVVTLDDLTKISNENKIENENLIINNEKAQNHVAEEEEDEEFHKAFLQAFKKCNKNGLSSGKVAAPTNEEKASENFGKKKKKVDREIIDADSENDYMSAPEADEDEDYFAKQKRLTEKKELKPIDHTQIVYEPFRKNFYIEAKEIADMTPEEVERYRKELGDVKVRGKDCPKPIKNWYQCGLSDSILTILVDKRRYMAPFAIQCQVFCL